MDLLVLKLGLPSQTSWSPDAGLCSTLAKEHSINLALFIERLGQSRWSLGAFTETQSLNPEQAREDFLLNRQKPRAGPGPGCCFLY